MTVYPQKSVCSLTVYGRTEQPPPGVGQQPAKKPGGGGGISYTGEPSEEVASVLRQVRDMMPDEMWEY